MPHCDLGLVDAEAGEVVALRPRAQGQKHLPRFRFPLASSPATRRVLESGEAWICNDTGYEPLYDPSLPEGRLQSVLVAPIRVRSRSLGAFFALNRPGGFRGIDAAALSAVGATAGLALDSLLRHGQEAEQRMLQEALGGISRALVSTPDEEVALGNVLDQIWRVLRYRVAAALLLEVDQLRVVASRGGATGLRVAKSEVGELGEVVDGRELRVLSDARMCLQAIGLPSTPNLILAVPLRAKEETLGALVVGFDDEAATDAREGVMLKAIADQAAVFLDTALTLRRERHARGRTAALGRFTRLAATRHEPIALLQAAADEILPLSGADRVIVYAAHSRNAVLIPMGRATLIPDDVPVPQDRLDLTSGPLTPLLEDRRPIQFGGHAAVPAELPTFAGVRSLLLIPLVVREVLVGAVALAWTDEPRAFDPLLTDFLHDVVQPVALGLENSRLFTKLTQMASTDELTQLANRRRFMETLRTEIGRARRSNAELSLIILDVDHLKRINDTFGHPAGDAVIRHVADMLTRRRRASDLPARLGGEEFAVLLPGTDHDAAMTLAERIRREISEREVVPVGSMTVSMGVATLGPDDGLEDLIRVADQRLYMAKQGGRNQVRGLASDEIVVLPPEG